MISLNPNLLFGTTLIILIASAKCCIYSTDLAELGQILLKNLNETEFTNYEAIEDFKRSVEFAINSSIVATPEAVREIAIASKTHKRVKSILGATDNIRHAFDTIFSLLTPYNNYDVKEVTNVVKNLNLSALLKNSVAVYTGLFEKPARVRKLIKTFEAQSHEYHCRSTSSVHQKIIALHNRAILNLLMGFSSILYLSKQFRRAEKDIRLSAKETPQLLINGYNHYIEQSQNRLNSLTEGVSRDIHRCDPMKHEHEKTYDRLYDLVEYYLTSERFLNENNQCSTTPKTYDGVKHSPEVKKYIDDTLLCYGTLYQCEKVDLKHLFHYGEDIYRRYHGFSVADPASPEGETVYGYIGDATIAYTSDDLNGVGENSPNHPDVNLTSAELEALKSCPIYGCYCDNHDSSRTTRYFSTKLVTSTVKYDRVITGLRFVVQDRVVYIQIQTGKLIGLGVVDPTSVKWKEIELVTVTGVDEKSSDAEFIKLDYNTRSLYLDDVSSDKGFYLTGVQFVRANGGVRIAAQATPYEGFVLVTHQKPVTLEISDVNRTELKLDNSKIPLDMLDLKSQPISVQNRDYVKFQPSDIKNDAGQTTVPFLDIQPVETSPPTALGGFGIVLKASPGSASFLALKLLSPKY